MNEAKHNNPEDQKFRPTIEEIEQPPLAKKPSTHSQRRLRKRVFRQAIGRGTALDQAGIAADEAAEKARPHLTPDQSAEPEPGHEPDQS